jgi:AraC family transcriptional regulator
VKLEIRQREPARVATRRYTGPLGESVARFWRTDIAPWLAANELLDCPRYGVALDDPATTPPEKCRYDCCVALPPGISLPGAPETTIAGGAYAVTCFKGTGAAIGAAWSEFVGVCMARGCAFDAERAAFEHYPRGTSLGLKTGVIGCELCFPVVV